MAMRSDWRYGAYSPPASGPSSQSRPSHFRSSISCASKRASLRSRSVSSIRRIMVPAVLRAYSQFTSAVRALPTWSWPVGEGAKRTRTPESGIFESAVTLRCYQDGGKNLGLRPAFPNTQVGVGNAVVPAQAVFVQQNPGVAQHQRGRAQQRGQQTPPPLFSSRNGSIQSHQFQTASPQPKRRAAIHHQQILVTEKQNPRCYQGRDEQLWLRRNFLRDFRGDPSPQSKGSADRNRIHDDRQRSP